MNDRDFITLGQAPRDPTSSAGISSNLPPIPSGVVAGRIRPRDSSIPRQRSDDEPGSPTFHRDPLDPTAAEERPHRQSTDDTDSTGDAVEGERQRKRIRVDPDPTPLSTPAAPNIARRDRARFNDSPGGAHFPQKFAFPHNQPQYGQTDMPPPPEFRFPNPWPGAEVRQRDSEPSILPPQLHITDRPLPRPEGTRHGPWGNRDSTLASATNPTSAISTPMTGRLPIPSDSDDSFPINSPHPRHIHRYSQSSGDIRVDSMGDPAGVMGVPRSNPPNPIEGRHRLAFNMQDSSISVVGGHTGLGPAVKPTLNAQGQKTCRQCGQPGREQDGKCAERLGPAGRGTVCDHTFRCRKKMKRVERCGTQNAGSLGQHLPLGVLSSSIGGRHGRAGPNAVFPVPEAVFPSPPPVITHLGGDGYRNYEPAPAQGGTPRVSVYSITDEEDEPEVVPVAPPREPTPPPPSPPQPTRRPKGKGKRR